MISANNITLRVGKKALFEDVNIKFNIIFNFPAGFLIIFNSFFVFSAKIKD